MTSTFDKRIALFPDSTRISERGVLSIGGCDLDLVAGSMGTPIYVYDSLTLDNSVRAYKKALASYPAESGLTYAGKAFLCAPIVRWAREHGLMIDCTGVGEIHIAAENGMPHKSILVHGVNKSQADILAAFRWAGTIVVDNLTELERILALAKTGLHPTPDIWLRLRPGVAVATHTYTQTGQEDSKFGMSAAELYQAAALCLSKKLPLTGLHFHQGSHFHDPAPLTPAIEMALDLVQELHSQTRWYPKIICPGGGWGVPYHEDDLPHATIDDYTQFVVRAVVAGCQARNIPLPKLQLEPGRSLVARAGVAIYRVGAVKFTATRRWLMIDGGLADNPRPALYGARYTALPVVNPQRQPAGSAWLAGPYCESGDILIQDLPMPEVKTGELVAVPVSGAYQVSMSSNYNGALRPAVVWLQDGEADVRVFREELDDLIRRESPF